MARPSSKTVVTKVLSVFVMVSLLCAAGPFVIVKQVSAAQVQNRSVTLSDPTPTNTAIYHLSFDIATAGTLGSIEILFCDNSPLITDPCNPPWGFDALHATVSNESGATGMLISPNSGQNDVILTQNPSAIGNVTVSFDLDGIVNPNDAGPYFARIFTYPTNDASGPNTDFGGLAFAIGGGFPINTVVPPYLTFCLGTTISNFDCSTASGDFINLGDLSSATTRTGTTQMVTATNAGSGYNVSMAGTTLTSGNNILPAMHTATSQVGTSQFGLNLRANTNPVVGQDVTGPGSGAVTANYNLPNKFTFTNGDVVAHAVNVQDFRKYTASYIVNINKDQAPGVYSTTLTYVCLANF